MSKHQTGIMQKATNILIEQQPDALIFDIDTIPETGKNGYMEFYATLRKVAPEAKIVILTSTATSSKAVRLSNNGTPCLTLPTTHDQIITAVHSVINQPDPAFNPISFLAPDVGTGYPTMIKTKSRVMHQMLEKVALVSKTETTVLLTGETGTGKGVIARLIHDSSQRSGESMMSVHCGAIPESLIESELFGHAKGSFTGAIKTKKGKFEQASKGTIFLDEIGTITAATQIKLLQVIQDRTFQPIGSNRTQSTDVRIIAASNNDLGKMAQQGEFRTDLFYRLNIFPVEVPPLRMRKEDISLFIDYFLCQFNAKHGKMIFDLTDEVLECFQQYEWPGNIRELENLLERAYILAQNSYLDATLFPTDLFKLRPSQINPLTCKNNTSHTSIKRLAEIRDEAVRKSEKEYLCTLLSMHNGKIEATAKTAGVSRRQIHKLLTKHNIKKELFKNKAHKVAEDSHQ
ncbi:sigma-54-dependent transcriptional regulator [Desulfosediminicola ganghwensis]|uniref:sigma-54-dependent transcriptional regulator n=1 Tax=Desulfosediminicola ganghwensis TaxID=2569540 RepID=UPI0015949353|nr:sigma-54 dependent transcriptional regulator [Desulfosediminicola ganghwensis]